MEFIIRERISRILGIRIEKDRWDETIKAVDTSGKITLRKVLDIVIELCKYLEENEKRTV